MQTLCKNKTFQENLWRSACTAQCTCYALPGSASGRVSLEVYVVQLSKRLEVSRDVVLFSVLKSFCIICLFFNTTVPVYSIISFLTCGSPPTNSFRSSSSGRVTSDVSIDSAMLYDGIYKQSEN